MELDFDNEIDALMREEAAGRTITIGEFAGMHLEADEIAAFAEGAVPDRARAAFVLHFADCDACRRSLSNVLELNAADQPAAVGSVAAPVEETAAVIPWYRRIFLFPNLAYVLGGLVVLFAGFIGLSVLTRTYQSGQSEVSSVSANKALPAIGQPQPTVSESFDSNTAASSDTTAAPNSSVNTASAVSNSALLSSPVSNPAANAASKTKPDGSLAESADLPKATEPLAAAPPPPPPAKDNSFLTDGTDTRRAQEVPAMRPATERDRKEEQKPVQQQQQQQGNLSLMRNGPSAKSKGPARNDQAERSAALNAEMEKKADDRVSGAGSAAPSDKKRVSGRTFEFRQGAWYDTTYQGQGTINVRRNTSDYRKLDSGLRGIAESFVGTVVAIWNGKAYRIQ